MFLLTPDIIYPQALAVVLTEQRYILWISVNTQATLHEWTQRIYQKSHLSKFSEHQDQASSVICDILSFTAATPFIHKRKHYSTSGIPNTESQVSGHKNT